MIKINFLGTSGSIPTAKRNHTAVLLTYNGDNILLDCGEGTQRQFKKARLNAMKITHILITHWHGDHTLGLPGLIQSLAISGYNKTLHIWGPKGIKTHIEILRKAFPFVSDINIQVKEANNKFFETDDFYLEAEKMVHGIPCNAYSFVQKEKIRIDKAKLKKTKIPSGPILQKLKQGKNISYEGKKFLAKNLIFKESSKKVSFVFDTADNKKIIPFVKNSDLLIIESTLDSSLEENALNIKHMTVKQDAQIAKKAKVKKLVLTHLSDRYEKDPSFILRESKKIFKNSILVKDFDSLSL